MKKSILHITAITAICLSALCGCKHEHNELKHDHSHETEAADGHDARAHSGEISLEEERAATLGVKTTTVSPGEFSSVLEVSGEIIPLPSDESTVTARTSGIVHFAPGISQGTHVGAGRRIATISASGMSDGYASAEARTALEAAKRELDRVTPLARFDEAKAAASAAGAMAASSANAQTSGTITSIIAAEGQYVGAGQPIAYISANNSLSLRADVPERHAHFIASISDASFTTAYSSETRPVSDFGGRLTGTPSSSGASAGYIPVYFAMKNNGDLISGTYCTVYLKGATRTDIISVPVEAIAEQQGQKFVYLREHPGAYRKQPVQTGESDGMNIEIKSGLKPGDEVVTEGTTFVRLAETSGVVPEGHKH